MPTSKQANILIVDDEPSSVELLEVYLRDQGFRTDSASTAKECIEKLNTSNPDIVILDVRLPDRDGLSILEELKKEKGSKRMPPVIIITAFHDMDTTIKAIKSGAFEYIPKPIDVDELEAAINRALEVSCARYTSVRISTGSVKEFQRGEIIGKTKEMNEIFKTIGMLSATRVNVLIEGETGTGKELVAKAIHSHSSYNKRPFLAINCSAIVENLLESELFGHEKGAFTGAVFTKKGMFEIADDGTVFLDEVAELPFELQAKLLRVLQEREFQRVGGERLMQLKARVIAATNKDLLTLVKEGRFREDLYYRLGVATIRIPPLRERKADIPLLIDYLLKKVNAELHKRIEHIEEAAIIRMMAYHWPGNVRELENVLTKAAILTKGDIILEKVITPLLTIDNGFGEKDPKTSMHGQVHEVHETERDRIIQILNETHWHYGQACELLGISRPTLKKKMKAYSIQSKPRIDRRP